MPSGAGETKTSARGVPANGAGREALPTPKKGGGGEILPKKVGERSGAKRERARGTDETPASEGEETLKKRKSGWARGAPASGAGDIDGYPERG